MYTYFRYSPVEKKIGIGPVRFINFFSPNRRFRSSPLKQITSYFQFGLALTITDHAEHFCTRVTVSCIPVSHAFARRWSLPNRKKFPTVYVPTPSLTTVRLPLTRAAVVYVVDNVVIVRVTVRVKSNSNTYGTVLFRVVRLFRTYLSSPGFLHFFF